MELDLDSFLRSRGSDLASLSSDDDYADANYRRTIDEILNESDSDSESQSIPLSLRKLDVLEPMEVSSGSESVAETLTKESSRVFNKRGNSGTIFSSASLSSLRLENFSNELKTSTSRPLPSLFGGIRPNPKPGAALAAAVAASRSIPTPHAAAIKSKRAISVSIPKEPLSLEAAEDVHVEATAVSGIFDVHNVVSSASSSGRLGDSMNDERFDFAEIEVPSGSSSSSRRGASDLEGHDSGVTDQSISSVEVEMPEKMEADLSCSAEEAESSRQLVSKRSIKDLPSPVAPLTDIDGNATRTIENLSFVKETNANAENLFGKYETGLKAPETEFGISYDKNFGDGRGSCIGEELNTFSEVDDLVEKGDNGIISEKVEKISHTYIKPLDRAEELEKRKASFGLHWEEGAAAQPMKLEGIQRGPPAVGFLQIDLDNMITRAISSQTFKQDHGSPMVLAVHINFVAIGTSKGSILIFPSKYYPQHVDSMDGKMLIFGSTVEKIQVSVTSMCFNQQGDLLLAGYSDGHLTVWDVQRGTSAKSITGEHNVPVTHTLFVGQDSQSSRQFKVVTGDSKGLVLLHTSSVLPLLNHFSIKTQCLLDGHKTGTVLCACPVIMDYSLDVCSTSTQGCPSLNASGLGSKVGGVVGGDTGWKLFNGNPSVEEGVVIFATNQNALVVRLSPSVEVYEKLSRPDGVREGSMPYAAWKCIDASDKAAWLAIAWDRKIQIAKLVKSELKKYKEWILDNEAIGVAWLDDQMFVVLTTSGQLCLFTRDGEEINQTSIVTDCPSIDDFIIYNTQYVNSPGNPEKSYHNSVAVRGSTIYILGPMHLIISRLLPWKERIQLLQKAGDWMGALDMAMNLYDGHTHGVIDLPRTVDAIRDVIMPYLVELILFYVDEVFSYISIAFCNQIDKLVLIEDPNITNSSVSSEVEEQYSRVGGVAVEFCVHVKRTDVLFDGIFSKFVAVQHGGTFLEILEPYILKDMLGCIPPEIMQALVEHYSSKGWLERVEQCILHMDISSVDFNQVVRLCREHGLYGALIYLFNRGLDDFKAPLEELLQAVQCSSSMDVATIGYRLLVYLKYSFQGLAFPPGHGCLHPSRLPSVREELLNFLLEDSKESILQVANRLKLSYRNFPNLCHILCLDTEATLDVLKYAFKDAEPIDDQTLKEQAVVLLVQENHHKLENSKTQQTLVQRTTDVLISILDLESELVDPSEIVDNTDAWPSERDINLLLEFIAYLVANKRAQVSATVLEHILKYLTSSKLAPESLENKASQKEKQVLSLLKAVPREIWNFSYVLSLCMEANFYQACGFIHSMSREYVSALDSYMKDIDEPVHAFSFVNKMLLQLKGTEALSFQSAVIQRIPELVKLSRECTFILVIDQLGSESQNILSQLHSYPQSLFLFLKTVIDVHMSGTLNFSVPEASCDFDTHNLRLSDTCNELKDYFKKISNLPKILHNDMIQVTDELTELYLELLCQYESNAVLKFLETFDNYRLENCLKICQEYGVKDAAAFLLERVGDVGSALVLLMSGIDEKIELLATAVQNKFDEMTSRKLSDTEWLAEILELKEAYAVRDVLHASVGLCQRNTQRLDRQESDSLWFHLFDSFSEQLRRLCSDKEVPESQNNIGNTSVASSTLVDGDGYLSGLRCSKFPRCANILRRVFSQFIGEVIEGMVGYLSLPVVMSKLLSDNGNQEFGDFKMTILKMLGTYNYERRILDTAKSLIEDDTFYTMGILKKGASHALAPQNLICCFCGLALTKDSSSLGIRIFNCGHATHLHCECEDNEQSNPHAAFGCPVCQLKKNPQARNKFASSENGLINNTLQSSGHSRLNSSLQHLHETDVLDKSYRLHQISRFDMLSNLQQGKALHSETLPQLRLAPPAVYHEKVQKGPASLSQDVHEAKRKKEKTSKRWQIMELKSKGSLSGLPLKSSIFGPEKNRGR